MNFLKRHKVDLLIILIITISTSLVASYYLNGNMLQTGYQDWMYHAYRALSLQQHGLLSWDTVWNSGLDYWRGYQWIPALLTALLSSALQITITKSMLILTVICFASLHFTSYIVARSFGIRKSIAVSVVGVLLGMTYFWVIIGFYSTMFAAVLVPLVLILWKACSRKPHLTPWLALCVGLSVYIHPLLAISSAGLWLITVFLRSPHARLRSAFVEFSVIVMASFFYWYTLIFISFGTSDPYQLSSDFLYIVAGVFQFPLLFYVLAGVLLLGAVLKPSGLSNYSQYLFWYALVIYVACLINIHTDLLSFINRFQLYRLGFFITPVVIILLGEFFQKTWPIGNRRIFTTAACLIFTAGLTQAFIYTSVYGYSTKDNLVDPVSVFLKTHEAPKGTVYITDSTMASYNNPDLRFNNGYNNQLLPQHANLRLSQLLGESSPSYSVSQNDIIAVESYIKILGVQYIFLPTSSPYIDDLKTKLGFKVLQSMNGDGLDVVVLSPPWEVRNATSINCSALANLTTPDFPNIISKSTSYINLDKVILRTSEMMYREDSRAIDLRFLDKDELSIRVDSSKVRQCIVLNQSHATNWHVTNATIQPTNYGMILLSIEPGSERLINLKHTWGAAIVIQILAIVGATLIVTISAARLKRGVKYE